MFFVEHWRCAEHCRYNEKESKDSVFFFLAFTEELGILGTIFGSFSLMPYPLYHEDLWVLLPSKVLLCIPTLFSTSVPALDILKNPKWRCSYITRYLEGFIKWAMNIHSWGEMEHLISTNLLTLPIFMFIHTLLLLEAVRKTFSRNAIWWLNSLHLYLVVHEISSYSLNDKPLSVWVAWMISWY